MTKHNMRIFRLEEDFQALHGPQNNITKQPNQKQISILHLIFRRLAVV